MESGQVREAARVRPKLGLKLPAPQDPVEVIRQAIATRTCIAATYNRGQVKVAPFILYQRDDALFVDAITIERDGRPPREPKLGAFRLSGLSEVRATKEPFVPAVEIELGDGKYAGGVIAHL